MKKYFLCVLMLALMLALTGCGESSSSTVTEENKTDNGSSADVPGEADLEGSMVVSEYSDWSDYVSMGVYTGLVLKQPDLKVTEEDIEEEIKYNLEVTAKPEQIKKGKVKDGDTVNIDYEGKKDGVAFDGGTAQGADLTIGSDSFIDGFEDGLIGVEVGDTVDLNLTFPENYDSEELAGQDVVFTVTVNYINGEDKIPELTDEWVGDNSTAGSANVEEYRNEIKEQLTKENQATIDSELRNQIINAILKIGKIETYPEGMVEDYENQVKDNIEGMAQSYGMELEEFLSTYYGMTLEDYEAEVEAIAKESASKKIIYETIAREQNITYTNKDLQDKELEYANGYGYSDIETFESAMGVDHDLILEDMKEEVLEDKVIEYLKSEADISIVDPSELESEEEDE